jgi:hypothetical protein
MASLLISCTGQKYGRLLWECGNALMQSLFKRFLVINYIALLGCRPRRGGAFGVRQSIEISPACIIQPEDLCTDDNFLSANDPFRA